MSVQLIVFPQYFDGSTPLSSSSSQLFVDGINFNQVNSSSSTQSISGVLPQTFINSYTSGSSSLFTLNTWYRFSSAASEVIKSAGFLGILTDTGILQRLSNLVVGATYELTFDIANITTSGINVYQYTGNTLQSFHTLTNPAGTPVTQTIQFQANSTSDIIVIYTEDPFPALFNSISCVLSTSTPSGVFTDLSDGQVICDLYEDEDIPLSLSVDDFKNVAEKVQSYSKAFNLPATKRNNQIFDNIFEITRTDTGLNFNPYKKTKCILKQDGFLLFEGYLRMLDISDKSGEISYNVNLYSEVVALADVLGDKTFSDLDFSELTHDYNKTQIKNSWNDAGTGITYTNASTSGFRDAYSTVKYPFVDWTHQALIGGSTGTGATSGNPEYTALEQIFSPFINIKYLTSRIFQDVPFTYESEFFDTVDFKKLYMDFNFGSNNTATEVTGGGYSNPQNSSIINIGTSFQVVPIDQENFDTALGWDSSNNRFVSINNNEGYLMNAVIYFGNSGGSQIVTTRWARYNSSGVFQQDYDVQAANVNNGFGSPVRESLDVEIIMNAGDSLQFECKATLTGTGQQIFIGGTGAIVIMFGNTGNLLVTSNTLLQTLRGELGQWEFLKGLLTMFNLVTLPDEDNPSNIKIEPYSDVFLNNPNSVELDWTDKVDVSEMKLMPLTDLNKKTIFKFVEDEDDFAFMNYKKQAGGHLYGSKKYDASEFTILAGEDEIIAEPFAATVVKPLMSQYPDLIIPSLYSMNDDDTSEGFDNSPRIMFNNGIKSALAGTFTSCTYFIPEQNGLASENLTSFLQFSHFSSVSPQSAPSVRDFHFGECQLIGGVGSPVNDNLFNLYWLPYYSELYNPDTRIMTIKVNLSPSDINTFKFNDTVFIKNRTFRVNKIDYKPNDLATVEFILIP